MRFNLTVGCGKEIPGDRFCHVNESRLESGRAERFNMKLIVKSIFLCKSTEKGEQGERCESKTGKMNLC